jgi:hypothetical protein
MADSLKTVKHVREVIQKLTECRDFIRNKQKKAEMDRLIQELRLREDSLLVKSPLSDIGTIAPLPPTYIPEVPNLNQFRVFAQQRGLDTTSRIREAAVAKGVNPDHASQSVTDMQASRQRAEVEAFAAHLLGDVRSKLGGRSGTAPDIQAEVMRVVAGFPSVPTALVQPVTNVITAQLLRESGR